MSYRNFLRPPVGDEVFGSRRADRLSTEAQKLDIRMALPYDPAHESWINPTIPSGYTYVGQFVAHDVVQSSPATHIAASLNLPVENRRHRPLHLDTLYDGGPDEFPMAYFAHRPGSSMRIKFKMSRERDIGRGKTVDSNAPDTSDALVADPRNDVHATISQITALFQVYHNIVVDQLEATHDCRHRHQDVVSAALFHCARMITTKTFRRIVRNDLLPRLLHPEIYQHYFAATPKYLDPHDLQQIPWEFAQAYRFGHAMVRPFYVVNMVDPHGEQLVDMMLVTSLHRPWRVPLDQSWLIQWSQFFEMGSSPNFSRRILPQMSQGLVSAKLFSAFDDSQRVGLVYRDLMGPMLHSQWSVPALVAEIVARQPALAKLIDVKGCQDAIVRWLSNYTSATNFDPATIQEIAADPSLLVFVLVEAAQTMDGLRLGALGSILLAEVLRKALDSPVVGSLTMLSHIAPQISHAFHPEAVETMPELIRYVAQYAMPETMSPPFV